MKSGRNDSLVSHLGSCAELVKRSRSFLRSRKSATLLYTTSFRWLTFSCSPPLEVGHGHDSAAAASGGSLEAVAAMERRFIVNGIRPTDHRFSLAFVVNFKVLELACTALCDRFLDLSANYCRRSIRHCRVVSAQAAVSRRRLSISGDHSVFPIASSHPVLCMRPCCRSENETKHRRYYRCPK